MGVCLFDDRALRRRGDGDAAGAVAVPVCFDADVRHVAKLKLHIQISAGHAAAAGASNAHGDGAADEAGTHPHGMLAAVVLS